MSGNNSIQLSVCLVIRNEEKLLKRCLASVHDIADEIIVIHDGPCGDRSLEIAAEYGARTTIVGDVPVGEAEPLRQISYEQARGDWILQLDADEFLSEELAERIPSLITDPEMCAYEAVWPLYDGSKYRTVRWPRKRCLFRRSAISFLGIPHFVVGISGPVRAIDERLEHQPAYDNGSWSVFKNKWLPWARLQARLYLSDLSDIASYQYSAQEWPRSVLFRRRWPLVALLIDPWIIALRMLAGGAWKEGMYAWRYVFLTAFFRIALNWNIFKLKHAKTTYAAA